MTTTPPPSEPGIRNPASPLTWNMEMVVRFWDYYSKSPDLYFTKLYGTQLLGAVARYIPRNGRVLDYACGTGGLTGLILDRGFSVAATDISLDAVAGVGTCYGSHPRFMGAYSIQELLDKGEQFAAVFLVEMVEHADNVTLRAVFDNVRKLLQPGGVLVVSTPNEETLADETVYCPCCNHTFHRWQHVRSWSPVGLSDYLRQQGFESISILTTDLSLSSHGGYVRYLVKRLARMLLKRKPPHLIAVARLSVTHAACDASPGQPATDL